MKALVSTAVLTATLAACGTLSNNNDSSVQVSFGSEFQKGLAVHCPGNLAVAFKEATGSYAITFGGKTYAQNHLSHEIQSETRMESWTFSYNNPQPRELRIQEIDTEGDQNELPFTVAIQIGVNKFQDLGKCWVNKDLLNATFG